MAKRNRDKGRLSPFTPLLHGTIDCPAWRDLSHGAKWLYVALKRKVPGGNRGYLSYRKARRQLKAGPNKIQEWFAELEHYGFIVLAAPGCLGVDGNGKAPHWRLTELGKTSKASAEGLFEPPTQDFLKLDGTPFDPAPFRSRHGRTKWVPGKIKKQNPVTHVSNTPLPTCVTPSLPTSVTPPGQSVTHVSDIERATTVTHVSDITRLTTRGAREAGTEDYRVAALTATERRLRGGANGKRR